MKDVYIVMSETGEYADNDCDIEAVFDTRERALRFVEKRFIPSSVVDNYMDVSIHAWNFGETADQHDHGTTEVVMKIEEDGGWYNLNFEEVPWKRTEGIPDNVSYTRRRRYWMVDFTGKRRLIRTEYYRHRANAWVVVEENN